MPGIIGMAAAAAAPAVGAQVQALAERWLPTLVDVTLKGTVVLAIAAGLAGGTAEAAADATRERAGAAVG